MGYEILVRLVMGLARGVLQVLRVDRCLGSLVLRVNAVWGTVRVLIFSHLLITQCQ